MTRADVGLTLFLGALLIAPGVPAPGFAAKVSVSLAPAALLVWFMLAPHLPVKAAFRSPLLLAVMLFGVYAFLVSCLSGRLVAIAYGAQWLFYAIAAGAMVPAYLIHKARQGRLDEAWTIIAWIAAIYAAGILLSFWTGPIYPHQVGAATKHYGDINLGRGVGFAEGANMAGGVMAVLTAFVLFVYRPRGKFPHVLAVLCLAGIAATMSRGAILAFVIALGAVAALWTLRVMVAVTRQPHMGRRVTLLWCTVVVALFASFHHPPAAAAWQRLLLNHAEFNSDVGNRLGHWSSGIAAWSRNGFSQQVLGAGFRSGRIGARGAYVTSHNAYVEILTDFGVTGLLLFGAVLAIATAGAVAASWRGEGTFALVAMLTMIGHNMTEVFWYGPALVVLLLLAITTLRPRLTWPISRKQKGGTEMFDGIDTIPATTVDRPALYAPYDSPYFVLPILKQGGRG